ncbi:MAG: phosphoribosylglycinamide formyltransferase [Clostridiales bacterium]|jgi:phosphoribosylglycinamide formyltransferase-1|nr:phosphoribosylglycinamide formyltransferase [Clostridiales bacterium]
MLKQKKILWIAVLVSGGGTNLQALIGARDRGEMPSCELALVLSSHPDAPALERAKKAGIPTEVISWKEYPETEAYDRALLKKLRAFRIDFVVCAGFLRVLGKVFLDAYPRRCINVHPSLLPRHGGKGMYGLRTHEAVLAAGETVTGATVHYVNETIDGGGIISQREVSVLADDTPETLQKRVMEEAEWKILPAGAELCCGKLLAPEDCS